MRAFRSDSSEWPIIMGVGGDEEALDLGEFERERDDFEFGDGMRKGLDLGLFGDGHSSDITWAWASSKVVVTDSKISAVMPDHL